MNRHQRRAKKHREKHEKQLEVNSGSKVSPNDFWTNAPSISDIDLAGKIAGSDPKNRSGEQLPLAERRHSPTDQNPHVSLIARVFARILLSDWVLSRVKNPEIERLLLSMAIETGRTDAADKLLRRQALKKASSRS